MCFKRYNNGKIIQSLPITEIVTENEFFDYQAKYEGESEEITPARIREKLTNDVLEFFNYVEENWEALQNE